MRPQEGKSAFQGLVEAGIALSSELTLDAVLQRLVEAAAELTGARYAALGVVDASGKELERFITHGIDPETHAAIGDLPRGRGILGVLIRDARPLRLHDIAEDDRSVGFPPNHPPMQTFLGVPVLLRGIAYGNLYLTEKAGGEDFTDEDEEVVMLLASQAAVAIENARLYESSREWARQLESLDEITNAMLSEIEPARLLQLVVDHMSGLLDARFVAVLVGTGDGWLEIAAAHGEDADDLVGERLAVDRSKSGRVFVEGTPARIDSVLDDPDADPELMRRLGGRAGLWAPLVVRDETIGVLMALDRRRADPRFTDADLRLTQRFAARAAVAVDLSRRVARTTVQRIVGGQEQERRRLSRELHDETGQALTSILLGLKAIEDTQGTDRFPAALADLRELVVATLQDVRRLAVELRPKALDDFGLVPALERLTSAFAEHTGIAAHLESRLPETRLPSEIETVLYRVVQEALTNVVKHAHAENVSVLLHARQGRVAVVIEDDGRGFTESDETTGHRPSRHARAGRPRRRHGRGGVERGNGYGHDHRRRGAARMTRILIVDDHAVVRTGLRLLLDAEDGLETIAEAGSARDAVFEARKHKPDVILMDVVLPDRSGIEATPDVLNEAPDAKVLVLSMEDDPSYVREAFAAGASGYVLKEAADTELVTALRQVATGERYVHPALGARIAAADAEAAARADADPLSDREREVLRLLALGHTNQEIAKMLFISVRTAETHRAHIMQKLRLTTRAELVRYALAQGLLEE